jgi:hypothetical protein
MALTILDGLSANRRMSTLAGNWRYIAVSLFDAQKGEQKAHTCVIA